MTEKTTTEVSGENSRGTARRKFVLRMVGHVLMFGLGALVAAGFVNFWFMPLATGHGKDIDIPSVVGRTVEEAADILVEVDLASHEAAVKEDPEFPPGLVLAQQPAAGFRTRKGRSIGLVVSLGRGKVDVPDVIGASLRHAQLVLEREGIHVSHVARQYSGAPMDNVVQISPRPGTRLVRGQPVHLLVSDGPETAAYLTPNFRGGDPDPLARALRGKGFVVELIYPPGRYLPDGKVVSQSPPAGTRLVEGENVELVVGER